MKLFSKRNFNLILITLICITLFSNLYQSHAHDLLPPEVIEFLEKNPDPTEDEVYNFIINNVYDFGNVRVEDMDKEDIRDTAKQIMTLTNLNKPFLENAKDFTILGIEHILAGLDHILFVISLVLILLPWKKILTMVSAFTVAHSITLIIAGSKLLTASSKIVEPIIAFSIFYMVITSVFLGEKIPFFKKVHSKIGVIFLFGLFHGLGFAGVFTDLHIPNNKFLSSLLCFNVGVEIGQIIILLLVVPLLMLLKRNEKVYKLSTYCAAISISVLAMYWVIIRISF